MNESTTDAQFNAWADDPNGPVALHLRQALMPVDGEGGVIFPPTYAYKDPKTHYNIDVLADGTKVATIDSVGAQANRMEPVFLRARPDEPPNRYAALVPQVDIQYGNEKSVSILEAGHRLGDAIIRSTKLGKEVHGAFLDFQDRGDASPLAKLGPTSLVFGVWDSRDTGAKLPRIVQSTIRAEDVSELRRSAQYNPPVDYAVLDVFTDAEREKSEGKPESDLAQRGFVHVPAVDTHGGVIANGPIQRNVTINLVALRRLEGTNGQALRRYVLGLALVAATAPMDGFLRAGCLLTLAPDDQGRWESVTRDGQRTPIALDEDVSYAYAQAAAQAFGVGEDRHLVFDKNLAKADAKAKKASKTGG